MSNNDSKWEVQQETQQQQSWLLKHRKEAALFAALSVILLIIAVWLPQKLSTPTHEVSNNADSPNGVVGSAGTSANPSGNLLANPLGKPTTSASTKSPAQGAAATLESPWQDAQTAKARREAQEILAKLMDRQAKLEKMAVARWAEKEFNQALQTAEDADDLYRQRQFLEAQLSYQQALDSFDALLQGSEALFSSTLEAGFTSLNDHRAKSALENMALAQAMRPESQEANEGLARAETLSEVMSLLAQSLSQLQTQQLDEALQSIEQAHNLDAQDQKVAAQRQQVQSAINDRDFKRLMGMGYAALQKNRYQQAQQYFRDARQLQPDNAAATTALAQVGNQKQQRSLEQLLSAAAKDEARENWQAANNNFEKALQLDRSLIQAKVGALRTLARSKLHNQLQQLLGNPLRLSSNSVYKEAQQALSDAEAINNPGPVLQQQISQLRENLYLSRRPIGITLRSDNATHVTLYKVGTLGQFTEQHLELIPGKYTAVGSRTGYRDVRHEFTIAPGKPTSAVLIQCTEKVAQDS